MSDLERLFDHPDVIADEIAGLDGELRFASVWEAIDHFTAQGFRITEETEAHIRLVTDDASVKIFAPEPMEREDHWLAYTQETA